MCDPVVPCSLVPRDSFTDSLPVILSNKNTQIRSSRSTTPHTGSEAIVTGRTKHTILFGSKKTGKIRQHRQLPHGGRQRNLELKENSNQEFFGTIAPHLGVKADALWLRATGSVIDVSGISSPERKASMPSAPVHFFSVALMCPTWTHDL